jgi:hypothetical protein
LTVNRAEIRAAFANLLARVAEAVVDPATQSSAITALAAIAGSIVGGLASFLTTYLTQRHQARSDLMSREAAHREELYSQFIKEAVNVYVDSLDKSLEKPASLIEMYSLIGRIRLVSDDKVLAAAEKAADAVVESYHRPPTTFDMMVTMVREGQFDPLKEFTEACREERKAMLKPI